MAKKPSRYVDPQAPLDSNNLPLTSYGSADLSTIPNFSKSYSETPRIADTGTASYIGDTYEHNSLDDQNVYESDLPNIEDERASNQSTIGALGDATAKFVGKTILSTVGNLAGTVYGVGDAIANGQFSKIWDNSFMDAVDTGNKKLDDIFHVYKNSDYKDDNFLQKLFLHPTQFTDEATDTASFMAGAVLSEIATSGLGSETIVPRALKYMKYLSEGAEAAEATKALTSFGTKAITLGGDLATSVKHLAMGASYEGIVEARQATMQLRDKMYDDYSKDHPNEDIPQSVKDDIDNRLSKAGLFTYLSNLALVGGTNLLLFPKLFGLGHETAKLAEGSILKDAETGLFKSATKESSLLGNIATGLTKPFEESTKFGVQGTISKTAEQFWDRKNDPDSKKNVNDFLATFANQLAETYTSKEGWNNIGMGMIIGALGAPGRGILTPLGENNPLGKYGYKDILDSNGNKIGSEKLPSWTGGVKGSFDERAEEEKRIGKVVNDLNEHTNFFKAAKANYDTLVENNSLQKDQDKALKDGDIFNFQNAKDDQIHSYVSARIKNNLYEDLLSEVDKMKKLSPDEFYTNFKGEEASDRATSMEKLKFQLDITNQFLAKAQNTNQAIKIADNVYRGDNDDLRDHLVHSIAASKNLDLREKLMNQSISDLSDGLLSNTTLRATQESVPEMIDRLQQVNPTAYTLNKDKIEQLLTDSQKLREKRQDYLDIYNHLFTQEGQRQFIQTQQDIIDAKQKEVEIQQKAEVDKVEEDTKKQNIKDTVAKAKDINSPITKGDIYDDKEVVGVGGGFAQLKDKEGNITGIDLKDIDRSLLQGTKEASGDTNTTSEVSNTTEEQKSPVEANIESTEEEQLTPEETVVVKVENNNEVNTNRELIKSNYELVRTTSLDNYKETTDQVQLINLDIQRTIGNVMSYLGVDKITKGEVKKDKDGNPIAVTLKTLDIFDNDGNIEINKFVDPKLFSQNFYKPGHKVTLDIPSFSDMEERGLQDYSDQSYDSFINNVNEFPIAIRNTDGKIVSYIPTQTNIKNRVAEEFRDKALADNLALREYIFKTPNRSFNTTITSKSPGYIIADLYDKQKRLFDALGDKSKLADKVKLGIVRNPIKDALSTSKDIYTDTSGNPFNAGDILNDSKLTSGSVYSIVPSSQEGTYLVYPMKTNTIGINNARTIVEATKLFFKKEGLTDKESKSLDNIKEFNFKNFKDLTTFINRIMYNDSKPEAPDNVIFRFFNGNLYISRLEDGKYSINDIINNEQVREDLANKLANRYFSVGLQDLNSKNPYISYNLNEDGDVIEEKKHQSYQHYLNDQQAITSNIRGVHIEGNEYAFTAQPVIGISNSIQRVNPQITSNQDIEEAQIVEPNIEETKEEEKPIEIEEPKRRLTKTRLPIDPNKIKGKPLEDINPILDNYIKDNEIYKAPKILKTLELPKVEALFKNQFLKGNVDKFYQEVIALGGGKEQTNILKNWIEANNPQTIDGLKIGIAAELSYTTEINTTGSFDSREERRLWSWYDSKLNSIDQRWEFGIGDYAKEQYDNDTAEVQNNFEHYLTQIKDAKFEPSKFYSNLTVPGGTNYTENEISTPQIEPSIKGHAQFSTKNGIGWFRSDEKTNGLIRGQIDPSDFSDLKEDLQDGKITREKFNQLTQLQDTKIRRILEVQSDLFQKGRNSENLIKENYLGEGDIDNLRTLSKGNQKEFEKLYNEALEKKEKFKHNQFLQLLNKDNNWINFFIKSIIQDSARKGYEEVHFPTGDTASKVEGHTTLQQTIFNLERGLDAAKDRLEKVNNIDINSIVKYGENSYTFKEDAQIIAETPEKLKERYGYYLIDQENKVKEFQRQIDEVNTEGFAKLKPIYNFYENVVQNILKKNYTVERVKDEHSNEWNKITLDSSHKGKIYYDINPNFSVMDKLFVNLDKFSDSQQREVVDSIIYSIEEGKKEGYSTVDDLFQYARDVFANTKDQFSDLNSDGSFDPLLEKLSDIDSNWDKFKEKTLDKLKGIGIKITKTFDTNNVEEVKQDSDTPDLDNIVDETNPQEDFTSSEANYDRSNYADNFSQTVSSKDTASAHLKLKLSLIPEVQLIEGKLEPTTNFMGMSKMMDLNKVWTSLQGVLTGLETDQIYPTITELAKNNPMYSTILQNIQEDPNTAIQNEFVVAFSKQQMKPITVKIGYADKTARRTINIFGTNRQGANDILVDSWYDKFKESPVVIDDGTGNLVIDTNKGKAAYEAFTKFMSNYNAKDINLAKNLQKGLSYIGVELSLPTIDNLIKNGTRIGRTKYSGKEFLDRYVSLVFKRLASGFEGSKNAIGTIDEEGENSKLELNNPFISETTALTQLAKLENITNPFLYESSYVGGDGKPRYSISNNTMLSKFFNKLSNEDRGIQLIQDKLATTYASTSIWGNKYLTDSKFRNSFTWHPIDSLGNNETNSPNKVFSKMNTKEKEFTRISLFQNVGRENSIFLAPIPSDKTTIPAIEVPRIKVVIDPETYNIRNSEAINALYTPFISEYNRIKDVQSQQEDPQFKDKLLQGYHFGMGEKFLVYDFLNKNKELFDSKDKLKIVDPQTLEREIRPEIDKFTTELIKNQLHYWNKLGLLDKDSPFFDKSFKRKFGDFENDKHLLRSFAADYAINQFISHFNYTQLISGDPALHGKKTIDAAWINYNKRLAKDIAPGLDGNFTKSTYNTVFLKDLKYTSKQFEEYQSVIKERADAYKDLNPADAQEYTTLKEHLAVMRAYGKLSPLQEAAGQRLQAGSDDPFDVQLILQPMKPVYAGTMVDKAMGIDRMYYIKTSSFPLIPFLTKGLEIDKLRVAMENAGVDRVVYESGTKLGLPISNIVDTESEQGVLKDNLDLKSNLVTLDRDGFRIQQEVPYHSPEESHTVNEGTQGRKLILLDVDNDDTLNLFNRSMSGKEAKQLYEDLHIEKMNRAFKSLLKDIGAEDNNGTVRIKDLSKLQKILIDEATSRNYNINDVYGLQIETVDGKQRFKIPLGFNNSSNRLESIMNSLFTNRVIKSELPGFSKIQGSSAGFSKLRTIDQLNTQSKEGIIYLDPKDTELNYIRTSKDGKSLLQADILVPNWFTDNNNKLIDLTKFIKEDGILDTDKLPANLLTNIGIRIPTQGYNSMMSFKVKGFLPKSVGDLAIVPPEIVAQMGSDFDVDKMFMYRYHYNYDDKNNILSKIEPNIDKDTKDMSNEEIDNSIVQYFEDRYKDPELLPKILEPNGYGDLPKLVKEIKNIQGLDSDNHFFSTIKQNEFHKNNNDGIAGRGIFSLFSTFIRAAQDAKLTLPEGKSVNFKIGDKILRGNSLYSKGFIEDKAPSHVVQYLQSASVDNAKEQLLGYLNINPLTMDVAGTILMAGYDENHIGYFLTQPIIREYVDLLSNSNDITNPVFKSNAQREFEAISKLQEKYKASQDHLKEEKVFSLDDMKEELKSPTDINQSYLLNQFLEIKSYAKAIRQLQSAINTDTNGLGTRYVDLQVKANNIDIAKYGSTIVNAERLFENNTIAKSEEVLRKSIDLYSNILPYGTVDYVSNTNSILKEMGKADRAEINSKDLKSIYDTFKSFIYSKSELLDLDNPNIERDKLLFGSQALGNRWATYTKTPAGKKNMLSERLLVRRGTTLNDPIRLEALNTPAANTSDTTDAMASYYRMYHKGTEEEKQLAKDIVNYFVLTGAKQGPNSISKYIPYDILEEHQFSNKLHNIDNSLRDNTSNVLDNSVEQFFQHNPSKAPAFDVKSKDIHSYKRLEGFSMDSQSSYLIPDGVGHLTYPTYMSVYDKTLKNFILYKIKESTPKGSTYSRIDLLGDKNITEYNANAKDGQYSIMKANQANIAIPESINKRIEEDKEQDNNLTKLDKEVQVVDKEFLTKHFDLTNSNPETTLTKIAEGSNKEYANIANDLKRVLVNYPDIKLDTNLDKESVSGQYFENKVSLNLDNLSLTNDPIAETSRVILHELLHAITANKIDNYDKLSNEDKKTIDKLKILLNQYKRVVNQDELFRFKEIGQDISKGKPITEEDKQWYIDNKSQYYPLTNLHEFIAAGLTDSKFTQKLKDNNFWSKLWDTITSLLGLNKAYQNDYDALYDTALKLGGDNVSEGLKTPLEAKSQDKVNTKFEEEKSTGYRERTIKNASADATIALAVDFTSAGERLTKSSVLKQNKKYIPVDANRLEVTPERVNGIVNQLNKAKQGDLFNEISLNIAGNGIYTMKGKYTQRQVDDFTYNLLKAVIDSSNLQVKIGSIRSGGQTGFDEAGIKAAQKLGIPSHVLAPNGWKYRDINGRDISDEQSFKSRFNEPLNDLSPRDTKQEFLSKYHKYDGQEISLSSFNKINESVKNNDKYSNIRLDAPFENGKRVLRVYTKSGNPLYDITPEPKVPKSKEEKIIDKSLKRLYDIRSKFKSNPSFNKNVGLQAKVEAINEQIKQIKQENTINIITSQAKDKLASIESIMNRPNLMSAYDIDEAKRYLSWYANIRDYINFNEAFEEDNKNLDLIVRKSLDLNEQLDKKKVETLSHYIGTEISSNIDTKGIFTSPNKDVGQMESTFESGMYSSNQKLQTIQTIIRKAELKTNDEFSKYQDEILPLFKEYQKKYRNYNNVLQLDKNGKPTGRLLNKYLDEYYTKKKYSKDDFTIKITEADKETFDNDLKTLIAELPDWNKEGTHDYAKFNQWFASHDPDQYIAKVKRGGYISKEERAKYKDYVTSTPSDKWLDPRYKALKAFGEDSVEMKVYKELDTQFRSMSRLYNNESNYIPEVSRDFTDRVLQGEFKGAFNLLKELAQNAVTTKVAPIVNSNSVDINGLPNEAIPVYMMSNMMNPSDKSYDLGRVLLAAKLQDFMLEYKNEVEPYLQMAKELAQKQPAYVTNTSDETQVDEEGNPILDTSPGRAPNLTSQSNYMLESFLYNRGVEHTGASKTARIERTHLNAKGEEIKETRAITGSKIVDSISSYTRLKALGLNPVSSVGRVIWGTLSNTIYAGDRKAYGERENIKSLGYMLQASLPGTDAHSKVRALAEYFDMRQQLGEIKFGKFKLPSISNPLAEATPYVLVNKTEDFIQHQTGISVLMKQKVTALDGKEYDLFDAFDSKGKWKVDQFGENPYDNDKKRLEMSSYIQSIVTAVHGDYGDITKASQKYILRNLLTMRKWLPRSIAVRFGKEYEHITLGTQKGRYLSYKMEHLAILPLIRDMYKAFTVDSEQDNIDTRNLRMNAYELAFIPVLWGAALMLKSMVHGLYHDDNEEKAAMTFLLNSTTRVSGDLTFFFNPYSAQAVLREPIPAFKTIMDFMDVGVAVGQTLEGKGTYKTGIHKGQSKVAVKAAKAIPIINQPEKIYSSLKQAIEK